MSVSHAWRPWKLPGAHRRVPVHQLRSVARTFLTSVGRSHHHVTTSDGVTHKDAYVRVDFDSITEARAFYRALSAMSETLGDPTRD